MLKCCQHPCSRRPSIRQGGDYAASRNRWLPRSLWNSTPACLPGWRLNQAMRNASMTMLEVMSSRRERSTVARHDEQLLRDDFADRPQRGPHPLQAARLNLEDNTLVVYSTDHGDLLGDHDLYLKGPTAYEGLLRVGLIMKGPGIPVGARIDDPVSTLDIAATFAQVAGTELDPAAQSRSLLRVAKGEETRDVAYSEWYVNEARCGVPLELHTVRTKDWKCTVEMRSGAGEMYDLREDLDEMRNLFDESSAVAMRGEALDMIRARPGAVRKERLPIIGMA